MASTLLTSTIFLPLGFGAALALVLMNRGQSEPLLAFVVAVSLLATYLLLEGPPGIPPVGAKQKLVYVFAACVLAAAATARLNWKRELASAVILSASLLWLGWGRFADPAKWSGSAFLIVTILCAVLASRSLSSRSDEPFLWPVALLNFAIGSSLLSLLGKFVGFAQVMGAFAAWAGGFLLVSFALTLAKLDNPALPAFVLWLAMLIFVSGSFMVGLYAPDLNKNAYVILSLTLAMPVIAPEFAQLSSRTRPVAFALFTSVPALIAVLAALLQPAISAGS